MIRSYFFTGIILLLITLSLGYWFYNTRVIHHRIEANGSSVSGEAVSDMKSDNPVAPSVETVSVDVADSDLPRLFGVTITNDNKISIIEDPSTKSTGIYRIDDSVAGFIVLDIQEDKVLLLRDGKEFEIRLRDSKGIESDPLTAISVETSMPFSRPPRPLLPPGKKIPFLDTNFISEETMMPEEFEGEEDSEYVHPRFLRKPEHESFETPLTPVPPIRPTFGEDKGETDTDDEADTEEQ